MEKSIEEWEKLPENMFYKPTETASSDNEEQSMARSEDASINDRPEPCITEHEDGSVYEWRCAGGESGKYINRTKFNKTKLEIPTKHVDKKE